MKDALRVLLILFSAACLLFACAPEAEPPAEPVPEEAVEASGAGAGGSVDIECGTAQNPVTVSADIPASPSFPDGSTSDIDGLQCDFDVFSWNSFIAVNHSPSGGFGNDGGDNPTVWESWPESSDIFLAGGEEPPEWPAGSPPPSHDVPSECAPARSAGATRVMRQVGKRPDVLEESDEPFLSGPLIDVNGWYSRFVITVNQELYDYIRGNTLYSKAGQKAFSDAGHTVSFPCSCAADPSEKTCTRDGLEGAIMVKGSWKVIDTAKGDDPAKFHTTEALVYTPASGGQPASCVRRQMGLVGLHIGHKTQSDVQWLWSTFEHKDNAPTEGDTPSAGTRFNYFIADCQDCNEVNKPPPQPWDPHDQPVTDNAGKSQVMRVIALTDKTRDTNAKVQSSLLAGTVWENYELISTQWPTNASGASPSDPGPGNGWCNALNQVDKAGAPAPAFLGNTTLETYIQGTVPQASSSCINCHLNAAMAEGQNNFSDFTYLLERAQ